VRRVSVNNASHSKLRAYFMTGKKSTRVAAGEPDSIVNVVARSAGSVMLMVSKRRRGEGLHDGLPHLIERIGLLLKRLHGHR
jgi:hypothetical protein